MKFKKHYTNVCDVLYSDDHDFNLNLICQIKHLWYTLYIIPDDDDEDTLS